MGYNKAKAEKEWLAWKNAEEEQLRELGVDEDTIQRLHTYDWEAFKEERRFRENTEQWPEGLDLPVVDAPVSFSRDVQSLLSNVEDEKMLQLLRKTDNLTLEMLIMKISGFSAEEICKRFGVTTYVYYNRMKRFRNRAKKFLKGD